jgi:hypothetical protein
MEMFDRLATAVGFEGLVEAAPVTASTAFRSLSHTESRIQRSASVLQDQRLIELPTPFN